FAPLQRVLRYPDRMHRSVPPALALALTLCAALPVLRAQVPAAPTNLDFESGAPGQPPPGWVLSVAQPPPGISVRTVTDEPRQGAQAVHLTRDPAAGPAASLNLLQLVDASQFRGRRVRFRMAVRTAEGSTAQMWMRVESTPAPGSAPETFFLDTMEDRPITATAWT